MNIDLEALDHQLRTALHSFPVNLAARCALQSLSEDVLDLSEKMQLFYQAYDAFLALVKEGVPMSCGAGCAHCCTDNPIGVTGAELEMISDWVVQQVDADELIERIVKSALHYQSFVEQQPTSPILAWKKQRNYCPLLDRENRCRAYSIRPIACRMHFSITPSSWCEPQHQKFESSINPQLELSKDVHQQLQRISSERGWDQIPADFLSGLSQLLQLKHGASGQGETQ